MLTYAFNKKTKCLPSVSHLRVCCVFVLCMCFVRVVHVCFVHFVCIHVRVSMLCAPVRACAYGCVGVGGCVCVWLCGCEGTCVLWCWVCGCACDGCMDMGLVVHVFGGGGAEVHAHGCVGTGSLNKKDINSVHLGLILNILTKLPKIKI